MASNGSNASPALWSAVYQLADIWSEIDVVKSVNSVLPRNVEHGRSDQAPPLTAFLHHIELTAGGLIPSLMRGSRIPIFMQDPIVTRGQPSVDSHELRDWISKAQRVENAQRSTLAWLRSSLAGYPIIRAPQLAANSPLTTFEITHHFIWPKGDFGAGLNLMAAPPDVSGVLGADADTERALNQAAAAVAQELAKSDAWIAFADAFRALDDDARTDLRVARTTLAAVLADERVDEHESQRAFPRSQYRSHQTAEAVAALTGPAKDYADAFNDVHALLTLAVCDVFGELILHGEPWPVHVANVETPEPGEPIVSFEAVDAAGFFVETGQIIWIDSPIVTDAVRVERKTITMNLADGHKELITARVLLGTGAGWPASSIPLPSRAED